MMYGSGRWETVGIRSPRKNATFPSDSILDALMPARVTGGDHGLHSGNQFGIAVKEFPLIKVCDRQ